MVSSHDHHWLWSREGSARVDLEAVLLKESDQLSQYVSWRFRAEHRRMLCAKSVINSHLLHLTRPLLGNNRDSSATTLSFLYSCTAQRHESPCPNASWHQQGASSKSQEKEGLCISSVSIPPLIHIYVCTIRPLFNGSWIYNTLKQCVVCTESDNTDLISLILLSVLKLTMFKLFLWHFSICFVSIINNNTISFQMSFLVAIRLWSKMGVLSGRLTITLLLQYF